MADDDGEKKLYESNETDDGEKKLEDDDEFNDDNAMRKLVHAEPDLDWMNNMPERVADMEVEEYVDSEDSEEIQKSMYEHAQQVMDSGGFDVEEFTDLVSAGVCGLILPVPKLSTQPKLLELLNRLSNLAITRYNQDNNAKYKFVKVEKANSEVVAGIFFYITFEAKNDDDNQPKIFQAKVLAGIKNRDRVESCFPKSTP